MLVDPRVVTSVLFKAAPSPAAGNTDAMAANSQHSPTCCDISARSLAKLPRPHAPTVVPSSPGPPHATDTCCTTSASSAETAKFVNPPTHSPSNTTTPLPHTNSAYIHSDTLQEHFHSCTTYLAYTFTSFFTYYSYTFFYMPFPWLATAQQVMETKAWPILAGRSLRPVECIEVPLENKVARGYHYA